MVIQIIHRQKKRFLMAFSFVFIIGSCPLLAQVDFIKPFKDCGVHGSITIYDYKKQQWIYSDSADTNVETLPASTFKIINLLIALETNTIKDEQEIVKWIGKTDSVKYGHRPEIYKDMTVEEAFRVSAGWVFVELAKKIRREKYREYLQLAHYGNGNLSEKGLDFWNFGSFAISPKNQVEFLIKVYEEKNLPFSSRNIQILKKVMISEKKDTYTICAKTGWSRDKSTDNGWWVGYVERADNVYFFATRIDKKRVLINKDFASCRKIITKDILRQLKFIE